MIAHLFDAILFLALIVTSLRVGVVYRELKRLRSYQAQYVQVFGETSRAADGIGNAVRALGRDGVAVLARLEAAISAGEKLAGRLEALEARKPSDTPSAATDDLGLYSRRDAVRQPAEAGAQADLDANRFKSEMLKLALDTRRLEARRDGAGDAVAFPVPPAREFRLAPSVRAKRAAGRGG